MAVAVTFMFALGISRRMLTMIVSCSQGFCRGLAGHLVLLFGHGMACMWRCGGFTWHQIHAAYRAVPRLVLHNFRMHRAGKLGAGLQSRCIKIRHIGLERAFGKDAAQISHRGHKTRLRQRPRYISLRQRRKTPRTQRQNRPRARHLGIGDAGSIGQSRGQRGNHNQNICVARCGAQVDASRAKIKPSGPCHIGPRHHKSAHILRHGRRDQLPQRGHHSLTRTNHSCRLNAPWLHP